MNYFVCIKCVDMPPKKQSKVKKTNQTSTVGKGRIVEKIVAAFHDHPSVKIERNVFFETAGNDNGRREIDVLVTGEIAGHEVRLAIECKNEKELIGVEKIDAFVGKLTDVGIPHKQGIYV